MDRAPGDRPARMTAASLATASAFRALARLLLYTCEDGGHLSLEDPPVGRPESGSGTRLARLARVVRRESLLVHGSPVRIERELQPRTPWREGRHVLFASDSVLQALLTALLKTWAADCCEQFRHARPQVNGVLYQSRSSSCRDDFWYVSVHERLEHVVPQPHQVYLYVCRREGFRLQREGRVSRWTGGGLHGGSEWIADECVFPEYAIEVGLGDLPCPVALHGDGTSHLRAMLGYRWARRVRRSVPRLPGSPDEPSAESSPDGRCTSLTPGVNPNRVRE